MSLTALGEVDSCQCAATSVTNDCERGSYCWATRECSPYPSAERGNFSLDAACSGEGPPARSLEKKTASEIARQCKALLGNNALMKALA